MNRAICEKQVGSFLCLVWSDPLFSCNDYLVRRVSIAALNCNPRFFMKWFHIYSQLSYNGLKRVRSLVRHYPSGDVTVSAVALLIPLYTPLSSPRKKGLYPCTHFTSLARIHDLWQNAKKTWCKT